MANPYPLPRETRESATIAGDGRATYGPLGFQIWNSDDVVAYVARAGGGMTEEPVIAVKTAASVFDTFSVTFSPELAVGDRAIVISRRLQERASDVTRGGSISGEALERELSILGTIVQELRRDAGRALAVAPGVANPAPIGRPVPGAVLVGNPAGDGFVYGPDAGGIAASVETARLAAAEAAIQAELAEQYQDETKIFRDEGALYRDQTYASEGRAQILVDAAQAAYVGFQPGTFYDLGHVTDTVLLFPSDLGLVADAPGV